MFFKQLLDAKHCLCPTDTSGNKTDKDPGLGQLTLQCRVMKSEAATQIPKEDLPADRSMPVENPQKDQSTLGEAPKTLVHGVIWMALVMLGGQGC